VRLVLHLCASPKISFFILLAVRTRRRTRFGLFQAATNAVLRPFKPWMPTLPRISLNTQTGWRQSLKSHLSLHTCTHSSDPHSPKTMEIITMRSETFCYIGYVLLTNSRFYSNIQKEGLRQAVGAENSA